MQLIPGPIDTTYLVEKNGELVDLDLFVLENERFPDELGIPEEKVHHAMVIKDYPDGRFSSFFRGYNLDQIRSDVKKAYNDDSIMIIKSIDFAIAISSTLTDRLYVYQIVEYKGKYVKGTDFIKSGLDRKGLKSFYAACVPKEVDHKMKAWKKQKIDVLGHKGSDVFYRCANEDDEILMNIDCYSNFSHDSNTH